MEQFHYDGEGTLEAPDPRKTIVIEYHERKVKTGVMIAGIALIGLTLLTGLIYGISTICIFLIDVITK